MESIGIKELAIDNWLQVDTTSAKLIRNNEGAKKKCIEVSNKYADSILRYKLSESVPQQIRRIFEVAKGAMVYGYFFYPLFTLGLEHICKVAEATVIVKCEEVKAPRWVSSFFKAIEFLAEINVFSNDTKNRWHALRKLRNNISHPKGQSILTPGMAIGILAPLVADINDIFC